MTKRKARSEDCGRQVRSRLDNLTPTNCIVSRDGEACQAIPVAEGDRGSWIAIDALTVFRRLLEERGLISSNDPRVDEVQLQDGTSAQ